MKLSFYTHGGFFHADEVTAYAICNIADVVFHLHSGLHRINNLDNIPTGGIIADIGREYAPDDLKFDHHQGFFTRGIAGIPLASAGMIWDYFGSQCVMNLMPQLAGHRKTVQAIVHRVDETMIQGIDAHDADNAYQVTATCTAGNVRAVTISHIIAGMNSNDVNDAESQKKAFIEASDFMVSILKSHIRQAAKYIEACDMFDSIAIIQDEVIILSEALPWKEIVHERHPDALFVISPSNHPGNPWSMIAVPVAPESRKVKQPIERPDWFQGFIHQGKWIAGGESVDQLKELAAYNII